MKRALMYLFCHFFQVRLFFKICPDVVDRFFNALIIDIVLCIHVALIYNTNVLPVKRAENPEIAQFSRGSKNHL